MGSNVRCLLKCVLLILCAVYLIGEVEGRGGGRGGGRGRSFRSSTRYRSRSSIRTSRGRFPSGWKIAAGAGLIYGWSSYRHRSSYYRDQSREPQICENRQDFMRPNGTVYAYFICPLANQSDTHTYCCGPAQRQHCCRFWDRYSSSSMWVSTTSWAASTGSRWRWLNTTPRCRRGWHSTLSLTCPLRSSAYGCRTGGASRLYMYCDCCTLYESSISLATSGSGRWTCLRPSCRVSSSSTRASSSSRISSRVCGTPSPVRSVGVARIRGSTTDGEHLIDEGVPRELQMRVVDYYDYIWKLYGGYSIEALFEHVTPAMKAKIFCEFSEPLLKALPLRGPTDDISFKRSLALDIQFLFFLPGDWICKKSDLRHEIYYVMQGSVEILEETDDKWTCTQLLNQGSTFGHENLYGAVPSPHTYRAINHVSLISLTKDRLDAILLHFPGISKIPADGDQPEATPGDQPDVTPSDHSDPNPPVSIDVRLQDVQEEWNA